MDELTTNEPAALELGCVVNDIRHIIVCGHSDCKAINLLYKLQDNEFASQVSTYSKIIKGFHLGVSERFLMFNNHNIFQYLIHKYDI